MYNLKLAFTIIAAFLIIGSYGYHNHSCMHNFTTFEYNLTFNLCPLSQLYWANATLESNYTLNSTNITVLFNLNRPNVSSCNYNSTQGVWGNVLMFYDNYTSECYDFEQGNATYSLLNHHHRNVSGILIEYPEFGYGFGRVRAALLCNVTESPNNTFIDFVSRHSWNDTVDLVGYSYYGCPILVEDEFNLIQI